MIALNAYCTLKFEHALHQTNSDTYISLCKIWINKFGLSFLWQILQTYNWDKKQQNLILSSFFWGYLIAQIPIGQLAQHFGAKMLLAFGSLACGLLTLLTPIAASLDWKYMLMVRALQGLFQGFYYPCTHTLLSKWVHPSERGVLTTITYSGTQAGSVVMLAVSGLLASSPLGWPSIFYCSGVATLLWTAIWIIFGSSSPAECSAISNEERKFIESMPGSSHTQLRAPWLSILRSIPVISLIIVHAAQCWGFWTLLSETPTYLHEVFGFDIKVVSWFDTLWIVIKWSRFGFLLFFHFQNVHHLLHTRFVKFSHLI